MLTYLHEHENAVYALSLAGEKILAYYDTDFESDNGLDEDEQGYEEYHCIVFKKVSDGALFEITYHSLPEMVCDGNIRIV